MTTFLHIIDTFSCLTIAITLVRISWILLCINGFMYDTQRQLTHIYAWLTQKAPAHRTMRKIHRQLTVLNRALREKV
jgi:hypothetical protein